MAFGAAVSSAVGAVAGVGALFATGILAPVALGIAIVSGRRFTGFS